jgi:hypothetical protein
MASLLARPIMECHAGAVDLLTRPPAPALTPSDHDNIHLHRIFGSIGRVGAADTWLWSSSSARCRTKTSTAESRRPANGSVPRQ